MPITLNQIRQVVREEISGLDTKVGSLDTKVGSLDTKVGSLGSNLDKLSKKVDKNHKELVTLFNELDKSRFYNDQRITKIEAHLKIPTPKFESRKPVTEIFINPIQQ